MYCYLRSPVDMNRRSTSCTLTLITLTLRVISSALSLSCIAFNCERVNWASLCLDVMVRMARFRSEVDQFYTQYIQKESFKLKQLRWCDIMNVLVRPYSSTFISSCSSSRLIRQALFFITILMVGTRRRLVRGFVGLG